MNILIGFLLLSSGPLDVTEDALLTRRGQAAERLRSALSEPGPEQGLAGLIRETEAATRQLQSSPLAVNLAEQAEAARWRALFDTQDAKAQLTVAVRGAIDDLEFTPLLEADLPVGFPAPVPAGELQLKCYPAYRMVRADMTGPSGRGAFWKLFNHITENDIAMTAPVESTWAGQRETSMAFLYGSPELGERGPDGAVEVVDIAPAHVVSIGFRGRMTQARIDSAREQLESWIAVRPEFTSAGPLRTLGYNSPMVPDRNKYFEVQLPVHAMNAHSDSSLVIDFSNEAEARRWQPIDDVVMGGVSASRLEATASSTAVFTGRLSLENNGGFASVRSNLGGERGSEAALAEAAQLALRFRGDGKTYKLRLRTTRSFDGVNYEARFPTRAGVWEERSFAIEDFVPVWRGRVVRDAPELDPARVQSVGLMISDEQAGEFRLELASLSVH